MSVPLLARAPAVGAMTRVLRQVPLIRRTVHFRSEDTPPIALSMERETFERMGRPEYLTLTVTPGR